MAFRAGIWIDVDCTFEIAAGPGYHLDSDTRTEQHLCSRSDNFPRFLKVLGFNDQISFSHTGTLRLKFDNKLSVLLLHD